MSDCVARCVNAPIHRLVDVILSHYHIQRLAVNTDNSHVQLGNPSMPCVHAECHRFTDHHSFMCNALTLYYHLQTVHKPVITVVTRLRGAALDGKNTSPEKLTTQDGRRFPLSNN